MKVAALRGHMAVSRLGVRNDMEVMERRARTLTFSCASGRLTRPMEKRALEKGAMTD